jgi:hypothetical protein
MEMKVKEKVLNFNLKNKEFLLLSKKKKIEKSRHSLCRLQ